MLAQRTISQSLRGVAARQPALLSSRVPQLIAATSQRRLAATQVVSDSEASSQILAKQRLHRPVAPHLSIYKPQITWYLSMFNRLTGIIMSGPFYLFGLAYLAAPALGWHLESASLAAAFGAWPVVAKLATKFLVSLPFTFHSFNGIRHLMWDLAVGITNKQVAVTGWTVVGLTFVSSAILAIL